MTQRTLLYTTCSLLLLLASCLEQTPEGQPNPDGGLPDGSSGTDLGRPPADAAADGARPEADSGPADTGPPPPADLGAADLAPADLTTADTGEPGDPDSSEPDSAPDSSAPDSSAPDSSEPDSSAPDGGHPGTDGGGAELCDPCEGNDDCAGLGPSGECSQLLGGHFCTIGCDGAGACPQGYRCAFSRCAPAGARCDGCARAGCPDGQRCNLNTGFCGDPLPTCGSCEADWDCAAGARCHPLQLGRNCLPRCGADGSCQAGFDCADGLCQPASGQCDACGGCPPEHPVCNIWNKECLECGAGAPCPAGRICNEAGSCVEPEPGQDCRTALDCRDPVRPRCEEGVCVQCREQAECPMGTICQDFVCLAAPCGGVSCQAGTICDPATLTCRREEGGLGCAADADCGGGERRCNLATGQCYQADQRCDPADPTVVCAPGGVCLEDPLRRDDFSCTCLFRDRSNWQEPNEEHLVPCQPGGTCIQLTEAPGRCAGWP